MDKIEIKEDLELVLFKPTDHLSINSIINYVTIIKDFPGKTDHFKRFTKLTKLTGINLKLTDIELITTLIKNIRSNGNAKSCFYYKEYGVEKLVKLIVDNMKPELTDFLVSSDLQSCAEYLEVDLEILEKF